MKSWRELFPDGRWVYYEGEDPEGFIQEMIREFGFDPRGSHWDEEDSGSGYLFFLPGEYMDTVYGSSRFPLGS